MEIGNPGVVDWGRSAACNRGSELGNSIMDMRPIAETGIWIATLTMGLRGLGLLVQPELVHPLGSTEPMNPMSTATLGAAWLALAVMFAFAAMKETTEGYLPAAIALAILVVVRAYLMFVTGTVLVNTSTIITLVLAAVITLVLFGATMQAETKAKQ